MSDGTVLLVVLAGWVGIGVVLSLVLGRRGHDGAGWFVLGTMLGPAALLFAIESWRSEEVANTHVLAESAKGDEDGIDVIVGFDGSTESRASLDTVVELTGARMRRLTLATVVPFDGGADIERSAVEALKREAERLAWLAPGIEVLHGHPATALASRAREGGYELLALGTSGAGRAHLFGSAASELARTSTVPILLVGRGEGGSPDTMAPNKMPDAR